MARKAFKQMLNPHVLRGAGIACLVTTVSTPALAQAVTESPADSVVVTASRIAQKESDIPSVVEVIDARALANTTGLFVTDIVKKNASVDVIEYPGGQSGIGLRGFRPQFSGVNQRVLMLIDGRPAGATSMGNIATAGLERVEILKGSASAIYGPSAMGGVVNYITRKSEGYIGGEVSVGYGSFSALRTATRVGGALNDALSFDLGLTRFEHGEDYKLGEGGNTYTDFVQGHGAKRGNTEFTQYNIFGRVGINLDDNWQVQARFLGFDAPDTETPGAESDKDRAYADKLETNYGGDISLTGRIGDHAVMAVVYDTNEIFKTADKPPTARERVSLARETRFNGIQLQDNWTLSDTYQLAVGADYGRAESRTTSYNSANGVQTGSSTPFFDRETVGVFADVSARWFDNRLIVNLGGRYDEIKSIVLQSPLRADLAPGEANFETFNPRAGIVFRPDPNGPFRIHASAGTGFIAPEANQLASLATQIVGAQTRITRGNPDLNPEESESYDIGLGYDGNLFGFDVTWFRMDVKDRISSVITTQTSALRVTSYENAMGSRAEGIEAEANVDIGALFGASRHRWTVNSSATYYLTRDEEVSTGVRTINNVARFKLNGSIGYDDGVFAMRAGGRHVEGMEDNDFSSGRYFTNGAGGQYEYPSFLVYDITGRWRFLENNELSVKVDNLTDEYYFEKADYPLPGRSLFIEYKRQF
ncbi:MAG: TonB-dependent receptor [Burkholderiales bacterium]|nr:MAG: TonB-dependent receptor [Burkholderiales bacterium]